jgi:long-chain fatty acid transport protein
VSLAINQDVTNELSLQGDVTWTHWSRFHELLVTFDNRAQPAQVTAESWHNTARVAAGGQYQLSDTAKLRTGIAYDPSPSSTATRTFRIPDGDRLWLSFGANFKITSRLSLDAAYTHLFIFPDPHINLVNDPANPGGTIKGSINASADIFGIGLKYSFDGP